MIDIRRKPSLRSEAIKKIALDYYDLEVTAEDLAGERDQNVLLTDFTGDQYVLKISNPSEDLVYLKMENSILAHLPLSDSSLPVPKILRSRTGQLMEEISSESGEVYQVRLFSHLSGSPLAEQRPFHPATLSQIGRSLARLDLAMKDHWHPIFRREFDWSVYRASDVLRRYLHYVSDNANKTLVELFLYRFEAFTKPNLLYFQNGIIHNDPNDYNILVSTQSNQAPIVTGIIDFGDMCFAPYIYEPALAAAYAILDGDNPIDIAGTVLAGYHNVFPRRPDEIKSYFDLIAIRLCTTVVMAARQSAQMPENLYLTISEEPAWNALEKLVAYEPNSAAETFLNLCSIGRDGRARDKSEILRQRKRFVSSSLSLAYKDPINIVRGFRQYLYDDSGRAYLDMVNNVAHVGHCHPRVVRAGQQQMSILNTNTRYLHAKMVEYAEKLCETFPSPLEICIFVCSGSEANELALRIASTHTKQQDLIVLDGAYHGNTSTLIDISPYKFKGVGGRGVSSHVHVATLPDVFRGPFKASVYDAGERYAEDIQVQIDGIYDRGSGLSAFIHESVPGCAGQIVLPEGYLSAAYERVRSAGGVCIADEVQVGFGRIGSHFWAFESQDVVPDIVTLGKPMGNGHPLAAVITTRELAQSFNNGMEYFNTYGGNPVSCAIGMAVLEVIAEERLQENAASVGTFLLAGLGKLRQNYPIIGDVRGLGLFIGIELVRDRDKQIPAVDEANRIVEMMKGRGILLSVDGLHHNVIKIKPPLVITDADVSRFIRELGDVLEHL